MILSYIYSIQSYSKGGGVVPLVNTKEKDAKSLYHIETRVATSFNDRTILK